MRVIAGRFGGRRLRAPEGSGTRPVTDRVKESVFSSLGERVTGAVVADLYAGAGSFGIEALSRGAVSVVFVEAARPARAALEANLFDMGLTARRPAGGRSGFVGVGFLDDGAGFAVSVVAGTVDRWLDEGAHDRPLDLVFCDPPWPLATDELTAVIERLAPLLAEGALVVATRRAGDPVPEPVGFVIDNDRRHGDARIIRYEKEAR